MNGNGEFLDYARKYRLEAFDSAIYRMIQRGELCFSFKEGCNLWEYDGSIISLENENLQI